MAKSDFSDKKDYYNSVRNYAVVFNHFKNKWICEDKNETHKDNENLQGFYKTKKGQKSVCNSLNYMLS